MELVTRHDIIKEARAAKWRAGRPYSSGLAVHSCAFLFVGALWLAISYFIFHSAIIPEGHDLSRSARIEDTVLVESVAWFFIHGLTATLLRSIFATIHQINKDKQLWQAGSVRELIAKKNEELVLAFDAIKEGEARFHAEQEAVAKAERDTAEAVAALIRQQELDRLTRENYVSARIKAHS